MWETPPQRRSRVWNTSFKFIAFRQVFSKKCGKRRKRWREEQNTRGRKVREGGRWEQAWDTPTPLHGSSLFRSHTADRANRKSAALNRSVESVKVGSETRSAGMSTYHGHRSYSTDSVGSDLVFTEENHYQGMLRAMDERKGTAELLCFLASSYSLFYCIKPVVYLLIGQWFIGDS